MSTTIATPAPIKITATEARDYTMLAQLALRWIADRHDMGKVIVMDDGTLHGWCTNKCSWKPISQMMAQRHVRQCLDSIMVTQDGRQPVPLRPTRATVDEVIAAIRQTVTYVHGGTPGQPMWIDTPPANLPTTNPNHYIRIAGQPQMIHWPTATIYPSVPELWGVPEYTIDPARMTKAMGETCPPALDRILTDQWGDDQQARTMLRRALGVILTRQTHLEQVYAFVGAPRAGKSALAEALRRIMGTHVADTSTHELASPFGLASLVGASLGIISEASMSGSQFSQAINRLLAITGGDTVIVNKKYQDSVNAKIKANIMWIGNEVPQVADGAGAIASRFVYFRFPVSFAGSADPQIKRDLVDQAEHLFAWALKGAQEVHQGAEIATPDNSIRLAETARAVASPVREWVEDCVTITGDANDMVTKADAYQSYVDWMESSGLQAKDMPRWSAEVWQVFGGEVKEVRTASKKGGARKRRFAGVKLTD